ncbi:MAG: hypothetical protein JST82_05015 [Bacteroidetes bacterium]|nr:hypothetical protein [Bacteroidota bacterium]
MFNKILSLLLALCTLSFCAMAYEPQGTTVKHVGCDVVIVIQIGIESDSEAADVVMIQNALKDCWDFQCEMPCPDILKGNCYIRGEVVVKAWSSLAAGDKAKFHRVKIVPGEGTSVVDEALGPNKGKSTGGTWYRREYSPKVYCHETMHLCGLEDRYRDCRGYRVRAGVDNCKDGVPCDTNARYLTPPCPGYEDDVMGNDVTKPFNCARNMMAIAKLAGPIYTHCSDSCCQEYHHAQNDYDPLHLNGKKPDFGIAVDGGVGMYHFHDAIPPTKNENALGYNVSVSGLYNIPILQMLALQTFIQINYLSVAKTQNENFGFYSQHSHFAYRMFILSAGVNALYALNKQISLHAGPELGYPVMAKSQSDGSTTVTATNMTTPYGDKTFRAVTVDKQLLIGLNAGASTNMNTSIGRVCPFINVYLPFTNALHLVSTRNKIYNFNVGAEWYFNK